MLDIVFVTIMYALTVAMLFGLFMMHRTTRVYKLRKEMIQIFYKHANTDIDAGREWIWRSEMFNSVSYETMLSRFWVPLKPENFYKDTSFLEAGNAQ